MKARSEQVGRPERRAAEITPSLNEGLVRIERDYSPSSILAITLAGIILAEVVAMIVVSFYRDLPYYQQVVLDASVMAVIIFPLLYVLSFKPLLAYITRQNQSESILQARLRLMEYANHHSMDELLQFTLDELESMTGSTIGFFHFLDDEENMLHLQAWSTNTLQNMCNAEGKHSHYDVDAAGVWADAVRIRRPIIHNDYAGLLHRKGLPDGHARVSRELVVPVLRDDKVRAILGIGNKPQDYMQNDVDLVMTLADFAWDVVEQKRSEFALRQSEQKFRTLADWTYDWEFWVDPDGQILYSSPSCERITGYMPQAFVEDPSLIVSIIHPDDRAYYNQHQQIIHDISAGPSMIEYRIFNREGEEHWIEHICRPLFGPDGGYLGRRVSNRDVTPRKAAEKKLVEQAQKEALLNQAIQNIQADIARDLHDSLGQNISYLRMNLEDLSGVRIGGQADQQIQGMAKAADESYSLIRSMLAILQLDHSDDPISPFMRYAKQIAERADFEVSISSEGYPQQLSVNQIRHLFYIFREAISNIEKYAGANQVNAHFIWNRDGLTMIVSDNGRGFDYQSANQNGHYGIQFMRERTRLINGSFTLQSSPGNGTRITIVVPYEEEPFSPAH